MASATAPAGDIGRHEKEGAGRRFQEQWARIAPKEKPELVRVRDFVDPELGRATPYGIYDLGRNSGWVSVGMDHDTAERMAV